MRMAIPIFFWLWVAFPGYPQIVLVEHYGARSNADFNNAPTIQTAIDVAHDAGGGTVVLASGTYLSGTIHLKSHVVLQINSSATLKAISESDAFPLIQGSIPSRMDKVPWKAFIRAENQESITITGGGTIDGSGDAAIFQDDKAESPGRPYGLLFINCKNIKVENVKMHSSAYWMQRFFNCKGVRIDGITVFNHVNKNNDGLDIDSSEDVIVSNCLIDSSDDAIAIKSEGLNPSRNIVITNCILATHASAIKLGTGSVGGYENIAISNIVIRKSAAKEVVHPLKLDNGMTGIDLNVVDGGAMRQISISNVIMDGLENPIHIRLGNRNSNDVWQPDGNKTVSSTRISTIENVTISQVQGTNMGQYPVVIAGFEGHPVKQVTLRDITIQAAKPGKAEDIDMPVNWEPHWYPFIMIYNSRMPAHGIVTNHTEHLSLENVRFIPAPNEPRPSELHLNRK